MLCLSSCLFRLSRREIYNCKTLFLFSAGKLVQQEDRAEGAVTFETYKTYMKSAGGKERVVIRTQLSGRYLHSVLFFCGEGRVQVISLLLELSMSGPTSFPNRKV